MFICTKVLQMCPFSCRMSLLSIKFEKVSKSLKARKQGQPVRFVYDAAMPEDMLKYIMKKLGMAKKDNAIPGGRYHNFKNFIDFLHN